jgi:hypothetical protein
MFLNTRKKLWSNINCPTNRLYVGFDSWLVMDGRYPDLRVGEILRASLEFQPLQLSETVATLPSYSRLFGSTYRLNAPIVFTTPSAFTTDQIFVIDCGFLAYAVSRLPKWAKKGRWIAADISLGIDQRIHFEHNDVEGIPKLQYTFWIHNIQLETTPWISSVSESGYNTMTRDSTQRSYRNIEKTDARKDDHGSAHYILEVEYCPTEYYPLIDSATTG